MEDKTGIFFAIILIGFALLVLFFGHFLWGRSFLILGLCALAVVMLIRSRMTEFVVRYNEIKVHLGQLETRLHDIAKAMESLLIAQRIEEFKDGNTIVLDYEPVPQSIQIIFGGLIQSPAISHDYQVEGRNIIVGNEIIRNTMKSALYSGLIVIYLKRIRAGDF